jgi:hypothetical protein
MPPIGVEVRESRLTDVTAKRTATNCLLGFEVELRHEPLVTGTKLCKKCNQVKLVLAFASHAKAPDGLHYACRQCDNERARELRVQRPERKRVPEYLKYRLRID